MDRLKSPRENERWKEISPREGKIEESSPYIIRNREMMERNGMGHGEKSPREMSNRKAPREFDRLGLQHGDRRKDIGWRKPLGRDTGQVIETLLKSKEVIKEGRLSQISPV